MPRSYERRRHWDERSGDHVQHRKRRRWPWIVLGCVVVLVGVGVAAGVAGLQFMKQANSVRDDLSAAKNDLSGVTALVKAGDTAGLEKTTAQVQQLTAHANETVRGPLWGIASNIPFVGQNVAAVKDATVATNILAHDAMPAAVQLLGTVNIDQLKVAGGGVNLAPFKNAVTVLPTLGKAFTSAQAQVAGVDRKALLPVVDDAIGQLLSIIDDATPTIVSLQKSLPTLLTMAGADGPRTYIVLFQNNAEIRATGGNPANLSAMRVVDGHISLVANAEIGTRGNGSMRLPAATQALYEQDTTYYAQNFTRTPDFPTTAQMFESLWKTSTGGTTDGVLSIDPVALGAMLKVTGPVTLADGSQLTSDNAAQVLMNEAYLKAGAAGPADSYFTDIAARIFAKIAEGGWDPIAMFETLQAQVKQQRVYAWMASPAEEAVITGQTDLGGQLATKNEPVTQVGIYLNDSSHSKLEYYLKTAVKVQCDASARTVTTTLTMSSSAPASGLTPYMIGARNRGMGLAPNTMLLDALAFAAPGGTITMDPATGDVKAWNRSGSELGRDGKSITIELPAGQTKSVSYTTTLPGGQLGPLQVRYTPTVVDTPVTIDGSCTALFGSR